MYMCYWTDYINQRKLNMFLSSTYLERSSWLGTVYGSIEIINLSEMVVGFKLACDFQKSDVK